jgi:hypothetical protein
MPQTEDQGRIVAEPCYISLSSPISTQLDCMGSKDPLILHSFNEAKRNLKCDEALPGCRNCFVYGRPCPGYRPGTIFRNETEKVARLMRKRSNTLSDSQHSSRSISVTHTRPESPLLLHQVADSTWEERAVCYFFDQFTVGDTPSECLNYLGFLPSLYATCRDSGQDRLVSSCLRLAVEATSLITLSNRMKASPLLLKARGYYGMALHELRHILESRSQAVKDETFATMLVLSYFEDISGERNGLASSHTKGFGLLMKLRGEGQLSHAQGRDLFICAYAHTVSSTAYYIYWEANKLFSSSRLSFCDQSRDTVVQT